MQLDDGSNRGTQPISNLKSIKIIDDLWKHGPVLRSTLLKRIVCACVIFAVGGLDLGKYYIEYSILRAEIISPNFHSKHEIVLRRDRDCAEGGVDVPLCIFCEVDGGSVDRIHNHAGKADDYRDNDSKRDKPSRKGSVFCLLLVAQHLVGVEEIPHFY